MLNYDLATIRNIEGDDFALVWECVEGYAVYGPYERLFPGKYAVEFMVCLMQTGLSADTHVATLDIVGQDGNNVYTSRDIFVEDLQETTFTIVHLFFEAVEDDTFEFRAKSSGRANIAFGIRRKLLSSNGTRCFPPPKKSMQREKKMSSSDFGSRAERHWLIDGISQGFSHHYSLDQAVFEADGAVPLFWWSSSRKSGSANFGDALSPVVVMAMSGHPSIGVSPRSNGVRLVSSGTIINNQSAGYAHVWGSGLDPTLDCHNQPVAGGYAKPDALTLKIHAVRGKLTRDALHAAGVECPEIFGDPGWLLPLIIPPTHVKKYELGIIPHMSAFEGEAFSGEILSHFTRYDTGADRSIKIISPRHEPSWEGFVAKIHEILSCKRIISSSFHGMIVPQAYGIPTLPFGSAGGGRLINYNILEEHSPLDRRIRDFVSGMGRRYQPCYEQSHDAVTDWEKVMRHIDQECALFAPDTRSFLESFPLLSNINRDHFQIIKKDQKRIRF